MNNFVDNFTRNLKKNMEKKYLIGLIVLFCPVFRYQSESNSLEALQETSQALSVQMIHCEERAAKAEADARIERDWRISVQEKESKSKEIINTLELEIKKLSEEIRVKNNNLPLGFFLQ